MKHRRRFVQGLILIIALAGAVGTSGSRAASADFVELHLTATSIDASVWFARGDGARWRSPCPNSGQPSHGRCFLRVERGTTVILTPQDGAISKFQRWEGACNGTGTPCTVQVNDDRVDVIARFSPLRLWYPKFGQGSISVESRNPGQGCGFECRDFANGEIVTVRAVPSPGYKFSGWSGDCASVRSRGCYFPMTKNRIVGATFQKIPPPDDCPPDRSCDPVKASQAFRIVINGQGTVAVGKMDYWGPDFCQTSCTLKRTKGQTVEVKARSARAGGSLTWGGRCRGSSTCRFPNRKDLRGDPVISVTFR
jgi:hypothetical protein